MRSVDVVSTAREIAEGYKAQGLMLTVRQLFYQFVARGLLPSGQNIYKKIVSALADARLEGRFPMDILEDRGRDAKGGDFTLCEDGVVRALERSAAAARSFPSWYLQYDRWYGQKTFVSVWVEKEALSGVFEEPCNRLGVGLFACKGYPSVSGLYQWLKHLEVAVRQEPEEDESGELRCGTVTEAVIIYFGDHDPDGIEIPKSCLRSLSKLKGAVDQETGDPLVSPEVADLNITLQRAALNMDQIRRFNPPPFAAKESSSRFKRYLEQTGTREAWELDALDPAALRALITTSVNQYFDQEIYDEKQSEIAAKRKQLKTAMLKDGWLSKALR